MSALGEAMHRARAELACPRCGNNPRGVFRSSGGLAGWDECPECHGEHRNEATIELLERLAIGVEALEGVVQP